MIDGGERFCQLSMKATIKCYNDVTLHKIFYGNMRWCFSGICISTNKQIYVYILCTHDSLTEVSLLTNDCIDWL